MKDILTENKYPNVEPYSHPRMIKKLKEYFGDKMIITGGNGKPNVITFYSTASITLQKLYEQQKDRRKENVRVVEEAAQIIKDDIKSLNTSKETYPDVKDMSIEQAIQLLPNSLLVFLKNLLTETCTCTKLASLGQALMQAVRPWFSLPLQLGLAVQMHHHFASKFLNNALNRNQKDFLQHPVQPNFILSGCTIRCKYRWVET